jgi:hypothetical protein
MIKAHADPTHELCGGTGIVTGATHEVFPDQPGAAWWKDEDRVCECVGEITLRLSEPGVVCIQCSHSDNIPYQKSVCHPAYRGCVLQPETKESE